jgi:hypothetical protein
VPAYVLKMQARAKAVDATGLAEYLEERGRRAGYPAAGLTTRSRHELHSDPMNAAAPASRNLRARPSSW